MSDLVEPRQIHTPSIGRSVPGCEARAVDEHDDDVTDGVLGEFVVSNSAGDPRKGFFSGYLKNESATEEASRGGWFRSGDAVVRATIPDVLLRGSQEEHHPSFGRKHRSCRSRSVPCRPWSRGGSCGECPAGRIGRRGSNGVYRHERDGRSGRRPRAKVVGVVSRTSKRRIGFVCGPATDGELAEVREHQAIFGVG